MAMASLANLALSPACLLFSSSQGRQPWQKLQVASINSSKMYTSSERRDGMAVGMVRSSAITLDSFFGGGDDEGESSRLPLSSSLTLEELEKEEEKPKCPPGLRHYETMVVLRPDISEEDRLSVTQRYEEKIVAGGGISVEVFNRGFIPLAYPITKKTLSGQKSTYFDGIYLLFTYFTKPESIPEVEKILNKDDDVIRASTVKVRERKY